MSAKCLCKIGILQTDDGSGANEAFEQWNGKFYEPLIDCDFNQVAKDIQKNRNFYLAESISDGTEYCYIFYERETTPVLPRNMESRRRILSVAFPEFKSASSLHSTDENETVKNEVAQMTYVTTKLYDLLRASHQSQKPETTDSQIIGHSYLQPTLREYQQKAVQWLLQREEESAELQHFYKKFTSTEGYHCYINLMQLDIKDEQPENIPIPSGGILADEMGLGKTVEVLALILLNSRKLAPKLWSSYQVQPPRKKLRNEVKVFCICVSEKKKDIVMCVDCKLWQHEKCVFSYVVSSSSEGVDYTCPKCWETKGILVPSAATVIVTPTAIKLQWLSEINKHISYPIKVLLYEGTKQKWSPQELASYDIILTDYNILRKEIHFMASNETKISFRNQRRSMRVNSPLLLVQWWRVCLDEAQMESSVSSAFKLVRHLPAIHRWAVTGTPIQRSLNDLSSLLEFIGLNEIVSKITWKHLIDEFVRGRSQQLIDILQKVMWRTCKSSVLEELGIPPQSEVVHSVELNNVERLFYDDEHENCGAAFYEKTVGYSDVTGLSPQILKNIMQPMLKLRQDCTLPVLCLKSEQNTVKRFVQPQALMAHLKSTTETDCKNILRSMASSYNGIAGIHFLRNKHVDAIKYYKLVIQLAKDYTDNMSVDSLLQIHALHNMIQAYRAIESKEDSSTLEEYEAQCINLEWKYLETYAITLHSAHNACRSTLTALNETEGKIPTDSSEFWADILGVIDELDIADQLIKKVNDDLIATNGNHFYTSFQSTRGILLVLTLWFGKILKIRQELSEEFEKFDFFVRNVRPRSDIPVESWEMMNTFIQKVYNCHLINIRNETNLKKKDDENICPLCEVERILQKYECLIFNKVLDEKSSNAEGTWSPTMQENILKVLYTTLKLTKKYPLLVKDCELQLEAINLMKTEYKDLMKLWIEIEYTVKAYDEMDMCKMRITLVKSEEKKTKYQICAYEVDGLLTEFQMDFATSQDEFNKKFSRLKYLKYLEKDSDPGPCPICRVEQQNKYAVLECGHHMCLMCLKNMSKVLKTKKICCAICRHAQMYNNIFYATCRLNRAIDEVVKGDYSSKILQIVYEVHQLKSIDQNVKILIFSHWQAILKAISEALKENSITFQLKWSPKALEQFKDSSLGITCMLMLLSNGSRGLNLVEATHVFLVEPILNPGEELQAIGRVHRIGQTKPTTVHRFIVQRTIEENIYKAIAKDKTQKWSILTVDNMKKLFELTSKVVP